MYMYVYVHMCVYVCMHVCLCVSMCPCVHACVCMSQSASVCSLFPAPSSVAIGFHQFKDHIPVPLIQVVYSGITTSDAHLSTLGLKHPSTRTPAIIQFSARL